MLTFGLGDEAIDLGADLLRHMDDIDAGGVVKAGRGLSRVDEAAGAVRAENRLAREALVKADIGTGLNRADDAVQTRLRNLPGFTGGNKPRLQGDDLRRALTGNSGRGALSRRLSNARSNANAIVSYDVYAAARQYNFPDRVTKAIVENLIPGRSIAIELKMLDDGSLVMKPAAKYLDEIAPYKHIDLKASKSDDFGFLVDAVSGQIK